MSDTTGPTPDHPGRRPTMGDVAAYLGVSRQLVSAVFRDAPGASPENRERVRAAARELGYSPHTAAQMLRRSRSRHLGVLFTLEHSFDLDMVESLYGAAQKRGYAVVLSAMTSARDERQAVQELLGFRTEGLVLLGPTLSEDELSDLAAQVAVVEFGRKARVQGMDSVHSDEARGIREAVAHLVDQGHRDIAHIDGGDMPGAPQRRHAFVKAMKSHGLAGNAKVLPGDYTEESGAAAVQALLGEPVMPTAIVAGNDRIAVGAIEVLIRNGLDVPGDISVTGFDDSRPSRMTYRQMTTVRQDTSRLADAVVTALIERLDHDRVEDREIVVRTRLVVRDSTGPAKIRIAAKAE